MINIFAKIKPIIVASMVTIVIAVSACSEYNDLRDAKDNEPLTLTINANIKIENIKTIEELIVNIDNYTDSIHIEKDISSKNIKIEGLQPGIYTLNIKGKALDEHGNKFTLNGSIVNKPIVVNNETIDVPVKGIGLGDLIFKEIFYAGTANFYFRNQFYELYNKSQKTIYLDGIYFANLTPSTSTTKLPQWPEEDGDNFVYGERVWKFPGSGKEYPLKPGESCVISQFAANHKLPQYNPNSPIDGSSSEFEFNMDNPKYPDQPAYDMVHVFYNGLAIKGGMPQYLTPVFGGAFVIFEVPEDEEYDPVNNLKLQTKDLSSKSTKLYAKIPITYVLDGVECGENQNSITGKRVPGIIDAGMTYVGKTYCSLGVARKKVGENPDGTPILQDTNNSTDDFDRKVVPMFRRYNSKMPSWNHTLQNK